MEIIKRINKQTVIVILPLAALSLFFSDWRVSTGVLAGGIVGLLNLRGLTWSINALLGIERPQGKFVILSIFRLLIVFAALLILAILKIINPIGLLVGFTAVFIIILKEGLIAAKKTSEK